MRFDCDNVDFNKLCDINATDMLFIIILNKFSVKKLQFYKNMINDSCLKCLNGEHLN